MLAVIAFGQIRIHTAKIIPLYHNIQMFAVFAMRLTEIKITSHCHNIDICCLCSGTPFTHLLVGRKMMGRQKANKAMPTKKVEF